MKKRKVISHNNMQMRSPLMPILVTYLLLDKFNTPGWGWGIFITLSAILVIAFITELGSTDQVDLFKREKGGES